MEDERRGIGSEGYGETNPGQRARSGPRRGRGGTPGPIDEQTWADEQLTRFLPEESELSPELYDEQRRYLLRRGDVVAGRFQVLSQLGFGGMGAVYQVRDTRLDQVRALKLMLPSLLQSEAARSRFLAEVSICQQLSHESIVRVHDLGEDRERGIQFFTMEYVEGTTLHRLVRDRGGRLGVDEALDIGGSVVSRERVLSYTLDADGTYDIHGYASGPTNASVERDALHVVYRTRALSAE